MHPSHQQGVPTHNRGEHKEAAALQGECESFAPFFLHRVFGPTFGPSGGSCVVCVLVFRSTAAPTRLWGSDRAVSLKPQFWVWRVQTDEQPGGLDSPAERRTEEAHPRGEDPRLLGKGGEGDQTTEVD